MLGMLSSDSTQRLSAAGRIPACMPNCEKTTSDVVTASVFLSLLIVFSLFSLDFGSFWAILVFRKYCETRGKRFFEIVRKEFQGCPGSLGTRAKANGKSRLPGTCA